MPKNIIKPDPNETMFNFCLIFKTTQLIFERIREYLLDSGAVLIYQTRSLDKIIIAKEGAKPHASS